LGGKGSGRKPIPWEARIIYKDRWLNIDFPPEDRTIVGRTEKEVLEELEKKPHNSYYLINMIVIRRHNDSRAHNLNATKSRPTNAFRRKSKGGERVIAP